MVGVIALTFDSTWYNLKLLTNPEGLADEETNWVSFTLLDL